MKKINSSSTLKEFFLFFRSLNCIFVAEKIELWTLFIALSFPIATCLHCCSVAWTLFRAGLTWR